DPGQAERLQDELLLLARDLQPGVDFATLPVQPLGWQTASGLGQRVWRQYLLRVSYLALTRIMLYRSWEDVDFVQSYLFDGGFDRDRLGHFFTPRAVVRFMLDRVGFSGADVFRLEGDERKPRRLLDFATGSGGFLVEAARRVIDDGGIDEQDRNDLMAALAAI